MTFKEAYKKLTKKQKEKYCVDMAVYGTAVIWVAPNGKVSVVDPRSILKKQKGKVWPPYTSILKRLPNVI